MLSAGRPGLRGERREPDREDRRQDRQAGEHERRDLGPAAAPDPVSRTGRCGEERADGAAATEPRAVVGLVAEVVDAAAGPRRSTAGEPAGRRVAHDAPPPDGARIGAARRPGPRRGSRPGTGPRGSGGAAPGGRAAAPGRRLRRGRGRTAARRRPSRGPSGRPRRPAVRARRAPRPGLLALLDLDREDAGPLSERRRAGPPAGAGRHRSRRGSRRPARSRRAGGWRR